MYVNRTLGDAMIDWNLALTIAAGLVLANLVRAVLAVVLGLGSLVVKEVWRALRG